MAEKNGSAAKPITISDVAKPGKSAPSASSKPILVTHRPIMKDPMMVDEDAPKAEEQTLPSGRLKIQPITLTSDDIPESAEPEVTSPEAKTEAEDPTDQSTEAVSIEDDKHATPATKPEADERADKAKAEAETPALPVNETADEERETTDPNTTEETDGAEAKPTSKATQKAQEDQAVAEEKRAAELAELTESRKYYLPINQVEKRKARQYAWAGILLIVLLAVAWGDVALDAHLITVPGVKPVTHFFSN